MDHSSADKPDLNRRFNFACGFGDLNYAKRCLDDGADIHCFDDAPFTNACASGHLPIIEYLWDKGLDIGDSVGRFGMELACRNFKFDIVEFLVKKGVKITRSIIEVARATGIDFIVDFLENEQQKSQPKKDYYEAVSMNDELVMACKCGNLGKVKECLRRGADIHTYCDHALVRACERNHWEIVNFLVDNGAIVTDPVIKRARAAGIKFIVTFPENEQQKSQPKKDESTNDESEKDDAEAVPTKGDIRMVNDELVMACKCGNLEKVKECLRRGADIHYEDDGPLHEACADGHLEVVKYLVDKGADIHACHDYALANACGRNHWEIVNFLVDNGAIVTGLCRDFLFRLEEHRKKKQSQDTKSSDDKTKPEKNEFKRPLSETAEFTFGGFSISVEILAPGETGGQRKHVCLAVTEKESNEHHNFEAKF